MTVHRHIGTGFQEVIYQRALAQEFTICNLPYVREYEMPVHYQGQQIGKRRVDFLVAEIVMVELKAVGNLDNTHLAQAINYLEISGLDVGLLLNFGATSLQFKRLIRKAS